MLMPNELMTNFVNAHAQVYVQWASSFSISIMHARLKKKKKSRMSMPSRLQFVKNTFMPRPARFHIWFCLVLTLPVGYFGKQIPAQQWQTPNFFWLPGGSLSRCTSSVKVFRDMETHFLYLTISKQFCNNVFVDFMGNHPARGNKGPACV